MLSVGQGSCGGDCFSQDLGQALCVHFCRLRGALLHVGRSLRSQHASSTAHALYGGVGGLRSVL